MRRWMLVSASSAAVLAIIGCQSAQDTNLAAGFSLEGHQGPAVTGNMDDTLRGLTTDLLMPSVHPNLLIFKY